MKKLLKGGLVTLIIAVALTPLCMWACKPSVTVTSIAVKSDTVKTEYFVGDALYLTGAKLIVDYSDGTSNEIDITADMVTGFSSSAPADSKAVTVLYKGKSTTFNISITPITLASISLDTSAVRLMFAWGEDFSASGLVVNAVFNDATKNRVLTAEEYQINSTDFNKNERGTYTIIVTSSLTGLGGNKAAVYEVDVEAAPVTFSSISLDTADVKMAYELNQDFSAEGLKVTAHFSDGTSRLLTTEEYLLNYSTFNKNEAGTYTIGVTSNINGEAAQKSASFDVAVADSLQSISLNKALKEFFEDEAVDLSDIVITAIYKSGATLDVTALASSNLDTVLGIEQPAAGNYDITFSYGGKTAVLSVQIKEITLLSITLSQTETTIFTDGTITLPTATGVFNNGERPISPSNNLDAVFAGQQDGNYTAGTYVITFTQDGITAQFTVNITAIELISISANLTAEATKINYSILEDIFKDDAVIEAVFNDTLKNRRLTSDEFNISYTKAEGSVTVTVTSDMAGFAQKSCTYNVVFTDALQSLSLNKSEVIMFADDELDLSQIAVTANYQSGGRDATAEATNNAYQTIVKAGEAYALGTYTVTYTYQGQTADLSVIIKDYVKTVSVEGSLIKTTYFDFERDQGNRLNIDLSGLTAVLNYASGATESQALTSRGDYQKLSVNFYEVESYEGGPMLYWINIYAADKSGSLQHKYTHHLDITVIGEIAGQALVITPAENVYIAGEKTQLDLTGYKVDYGAGEVDLSTALSQNTNLKLSGEYNLALPNKYQIAVVLEDGEQNIVAMGSFVIYVIEVSPDVWLRLPQDFALELNTSYTGGTGLDYAKGLPLDQIPVAVLFGDEWVDELTAEDLASYLEDEWIIIYHNAVFGVAGEYTGYIIQAASNSSEWYYGDPFSARAIAFSIKIVEE